LNRLTPQERAAIQNLKKQSHRAADLQAENAARQAVQASLSHHLERKSVASDKEILATAIKWSMGDAAPADVKRAFNNDRNVLLAEEDLRTFVTTQDALKEEKRLINYAVQSKNIFRPLNQGYQPQDERLNAQQRAAVNHALSSTDGITIITGKAGTGKTTLMKEVQRGIEQSGKRIFAFAPSSEASRGVQRSEGFANAETVAKLIQDKALQLELNGQVMWVDEAGMLSNRDMNQIFDIANAQKARIILSGDTKQHNSVQRGDALRILQEHGKIAPVSVNKIQRQKNSDYKEAVKLLSDGNVEKGFSKLEKMGAVHEIADRGERLTAIADDYYDSAFQGREQKNVVVISPTHSEGEQVTDSIRAKLKETNQIGQEDRTFQILKNLQLTEAEKQQAESYSEGQVLVAHKNMTGLQAGSRWQVTSCDETGLHVKDALGTSATVPLAQADRFSLYETKETNFAEGDKLRITGNGKSEDGTHLFNGTAYYVNGFDKQGNIELSNGSTLSKDYGHFTLGYVMTSHASQGKTADKVIISQSSATSTAASMEQFYVSVSRGKEAVSIYTDDTENLREAVSETTQRKSATELMAKPEPPTHELQRPPKIQQEQENPYRIHPKINDHELQAATR